MLIGNSQLVSCFVFRGLKNEKNEHQILSENGFCPFYAIVLAIVWVA